MKIIKKEQIFKSTISGQISNLNCQKIIFWEAVKYCVWIKYIFLGIHADTGRGESCPMQEPLTPGRKNILKYAKAIWNKRHKNVSYIKEFWLRLPLLGICQERYFFLWGKFLWKRGSYSLQISFYLFWTQFRCKVFVSPLQGRIQDFLKGGGGIKKKLQKGHGKSVYVHFCPLQ